MFLKSSTLILTFFYQTKINVKNSICLYLLYDFNCSFNTFIYFDEKIQRVEFLSEIDIKFAVTMIKFKDAFYFWNILYKIL